jgi:hypothetical protein
MATRCKRGFRKDRKTKACVSKSEMGPKKSRCKRGSRKNKKTGTCVATKFPSYVPLSSRAKEVSTELSAPMSSRAYENNEKMMREISKMEVNLNRAHTKAQNRHGYSPAKKNSSSKKKWSKPKSNSAESFETGRQRKMRELLAKMEEGVNRATKIAKEKRG